MKNRTAIFLFVLCLLTLDRVLFDWLLWELPNESGWSSNFFYGYEYQYRQIQKEWKMETRKKILLLGSSIAAYSLHPNLVTKKLQEEYKLDANVQVLSFAGMTAFDIYMLKDKLFSLQPDLIVYPTNFIDYRLHRNFQIHPNEKSSSVTNEEFLREDALHYTAAPQARTFYPCEVLGSFAGVVSLESYAEYISGCLFTFYRYRDVYYENLKLLYAHRYGKNTSYHVYTGVQIPERIGFLGWTSQYFSFVTKPYMKKEGFYVQVVPEILKEGKLEISFLDSNNSTLQIVKFDSPGWKKIVLEPQILTDILLTAKLSHTWKPNQAIDDRFDYSEDELGVRLQQNFGNFTPERNLQVFREERLEDLRYESMKDRDYEKYFNYRLLDHLNERPGLIYFHSIRDAKIFVSQEEFAKHTQLEYLEKFVFFCNQNKQQLILINNPENPLTLQLYEKSPWYQGKLNFLHSLSSENVLFLDWKDKLPMQDFSDFHHFTFPAMERMNSFYTKEIFYKLSQSFH